MIRSWKNIKPKIHPTAFISEAAYVLGEVEIGSNSSIWPGVVIRGDSGKIKIGNNTNIQDGSIVHSDAPAVIGDNVTIGHGVVCHARIIGNDCLIGNNATVNDGAEIVSWPQILLFLKELKFHQILWLLERRQQ